MEPPHGGDPPPPPDRGPSLWAEVRQYVSVPLQEELRLLGQAIREDARSELRGFLEEHLVPLGPPRPRHSDQRPRGSSGEHQLGQLWAAGRSARDESSFGLATAPCALIYSPGYTPSPGGVRWNNTARTDSKEISVAEGGPLPPGCCEDPLADAEAGVLEDEGRRVSWSVTDAMLGNETIHTVGGQSIINVPSEPPPRGPSKSQSLMRIPGPGHDAVKTTEVSPMPPPLDDGRTPPARKHSTKNQMGKIMSLCPNMPVAWEVEASKSTASKVKSGVSRAVKDAKHHRRLPVLHPQGLFMSFWRPMMLLLTFFAVFSAPFDIAFWWEPPKLYKSAGFLVDVMFILDSLLQFRVAYVHFGGLEMDPKKIARHYASTWLLPDVISNTPLDWFLGSAGKSRKLVKLVKLPKLIRLIKLIRLLKDQSHYIGVMSTLGLILLVSHYYACFWALTFLGSACDVGGTHCPDAWEAYMETLSVSVSSLTGNDGWTRFTGPEGTSRVSSLRDPGSPLEVHEEFVVTVMTVIGLLILACLFGSVFAMMDGMNAAGRAVMHKRLRLKREMEVAKVPKGLQVRVQATYEHLWQFGHLQRRGMLHDPVLSLDLRRRLALCAYGQNLYKVPMFANLPDSDMMRICQKVEMRFFTPGDLIYHKGEKGEDMHFVTSGKVVALNVEEEVLKVYSVGDFFGEICFLSPGTDRSVTVRCEEFASTLMLRAQCFNELTMEDVLQRIRAEAHMAEIEYHRQTQRIVGSATASKGGSVL